MHNGEAVVGRVRLAILLFVFLLASAGQAQQDSLRVTFKNVAITDSIYRAVQARFPHYILSLLAIENSDSGSVHNLADTTRFLRPHEIAMNGDTVDTIWRRILEYHRDDPGKPADNNVKHITPDYMVTELYDVEGYGLSAALVMDYSGSMENDIYVSEAAARSFVNYMTPNDSIAIIKFTGKVVMYQDFTNERALLYDAISRSSDDRNFTAVYDAVYTALVAHEDQSGKAGRRVVVVYTDGADNYSSHSLANVIAKAREDNIAVYSIGLGTSIDSESEVSLRAMADSTGGFYQYAETVNDLETVYRKIVEKIKGFYVLAHATTDSMYNGTWRTIDVTVDDGTAAGRGRGEYYVPFVAVDARVSKRVETPMQPVISGADTTWYMSALDTALFEVTVTNTHSYATADSVYLTDTFPDSLRIVDFETQPTDVLGDGYGWYIGPLKAGGSRVIRYRATVDTLATFQLLPLHNTVMVTCVADSFAANNIDTCTVSYVPPSPAEITIDKWAVTGSQHMIGGRLEPFAAEDDTFSVMVRLGNSGELPGYNITVSDILPGQYVSFLDGDPGIVNTGDSLVWHAGVVPPHGGEVTFSYRCRTASYLPYTDYTPLVNTARAYWIGAAEKQSSSDSDTVWCLGTPPPDPQVFVEPAVIQPYDSVTVSVYTPYPVIAWDLWVVPEDTFQTVYHYWEDFIAGTAFLPGENLQVIPDFGETQMTTLKEREYMDVVLAVTYRDFIGQPVRYARARFEIQSDNEFFLDENSWKPRDGSLGMRFKISNSRNVNISIYDVAGGFVAEVIDEFRYGGDNTAEWNGIDKNGRETGSGIYIAILSSGNFQQHRKFLLIR
ncbi:VWA domain-containing protein [bacterium]|nr:VWA domain-containing protein [bacterium]